MATLSAVVDIQDRASKKFESMAKSVKRFEEALDKASRKIIKLEGEIQALNATAVKIQVDVDMGAAQAKLAALRAEIAAIDAADIDVAVGTSGGLASGMGGVAARAAAGARGSDVDIGRLDNGPVGLISSVFKMGRAMYRVLKPVFETVFQSTIKLGTGLAKMGVAFSETGVSVVSTIGGIAGKAAGGAAGLAALGVVLSVVAMAAGVLSGALITLVSILGSLLVPLAAVTTGIAGIVGVIAFGVAPLVLWIKDTKELVDQEKKLEEQMKGMTKGTKEYTKAQEELSRVREELKKNGGEGIFTKMTDLIEKLKKAVFTDENKQTFANIIENLLSAVEPLIPVISRLVGVFGGVMERLSASFSGAMNNGGAALIEKMFTAAAPVAEKFGVALGYIAKLFAQIATAAAPIAGELMDMFNGWLKGLTDTLDTEKGMGALQGWLEKMKPTFVLLAKALGLFVAGLVKLAEYGAPLAEKFLLWLINAGPKIVDWMKETWEKYGPMGIRVLQYIGNGLAFLWDIFTKLVDAAWPFVEVILDVVGAAQDLVSAILDFSESIGLIDLVKGAFDLMAKPLELAVGFISKIIDGIKWLSQNSPKDWIAGGRDAFPADPNSLPGISRNTPEAQAEYGDTHTWDPATGTWKPKAGGASGAIVTRPTPALIGEAGPEAVIPLSSMPGAMPLGMAGGGVGGRQIQITGDLHFHGVQNINDFVAQVQKYVSNLPRESGSEMSSG